MEKKWDTVEVLKHSRHDWLNQLQLIKGNIALNRVERVNEIIDEIIVHAKNDSDISNLKTPAFSTLLLTHNWKVNRFNIEYEVQGVIKQLSTYDECLYKWCLSLFEILNEVLSEQAQNHLCITVDFTNESPCFFFDLSGIIKDVKSLEGWLKNNFNTLITMKEKRLNDEELMLKIQLV